MIPCEPRPLVQSFANRRLGTRTAAHLARRPFDRIRVEHTGLIAVGNLRTVGSLGSLGTLRPDYWQVGHLDPANYLGLRC